MDYVSTDILVWGGSPKISYALCILGIDFHWEKSGYLFGSRYVPMCNC